MTMENKDYKMEKRGINFIPYIIGLPIAFLFLTGVVQIVALFALFLHFVYSYGVTTTSVFVGEIKTNGGQQQ